MAGIVTITGIRRVVANMRRREELFKRAVVRGLKLGGLYLQRESQLLVPVDTGTLKRSAFTRAEGHGFDTEVVVGFTAGYALYVHEAVEMKLRGQFRDGIPPGQRGHHGRYWDPIPRAGAKFLERPAREHKEDIALIVRHTAAKSANWLT